MRYPDEEPEVDEAFSPALLETDRLEEIVQVMNQPDPDDPVPPAEVGRREVPEGMTAEKLRMAADWFDTYDRMGAAFIDICERSGFAAPDLIAETRDTVAGSEVQDDLRRWADALAGVATAPGEPTGDGEEEER